MKCDNSRIKDMVYTALDYHKKRISKMYPDGVPMDLYKKDYTAHVKLNEITLFITCLESILAEEDK